MFLHRFIRQKDFVGWTDPNLNRSQSGVNLSDWLLDSYFYCLLNGVI
jgi:hypothetical protein